MPVSHELTVHLIIHPVLKVRRSKAGKLLGLAGKDETGGDTITESFMHLQVSPLSGERQKELETGIKKILTDVRRAVTDWRAVRGKMAAVIDELKTAPSGVNPEETAEIREFLSWIHDNQFTFLGFREYNYQGRGAKIRAFQPWM